MADRLQGEIDALLRQIDQAPGGDWSNETQERDAAPFVGEHAEPESAESIETIHVYIVRESDLERPTDDLVVDSELATTDNELPQGEEDHIHPELDDDDLTVSLRDEVRKRRIPAYCTAGFTVVLLVASIVFQVVLAVLAPTPTITLIPSARDLGSTTTIMVVSGTPIGGGRMQGRLLPSLTLTQARTVPATGKGHQDAQYAVGTITFYNGLLLFQTVEAGTRLAGSGGVQVVTDHVAVIPPALATTPPTYGQVTVSAHATQTGPQGNIPVRGVNEACCLPSVLAQNTVAFRGGQSERDYPVVTRADLDHVVNSLTGTLTQGEHAALTAQLTPGEALVPPTCTRAVTTDHQPGEEAAAVIVTVAERCTAVAYQSAALQDEAGQALTREATRQLGTRYGLIGTMQVSVLQASLTANQKQGIAIMSVRVEGTWSYQFSQDELQQIKRLVAGKTPRQAQLTLLRVPGIEKMIITGIGENQRLPKDIASIHLLLLYGAD